MRHRHPASALPQGEQRLLCGDVSSLVSCSEVGGGGGPPDAEGTFRIPSHLRALPRSLVGGGETLPCCDLLQGGHQASSLFPSARHVTGPSLGAWGTSAHVGRGSASSWVLSGEGTRTRCPGRSAGPDLVGTACRGGTWAADHSSS